MALDVKTDIKVAMSPEVLTRLQAYIDTAKGEISGLGEVEQDGSIFTVTKLYLFKQECSSADTTLSQEDIANFLVEAVQAGADPSNLRLWWHSHVNMSCFWSGTDRDTIERFKLPWLVSIVGNKKGEYKARLDMLEPFGLTLDGLPLSMTADPQLLEEVAAEVKEKVTVVNIPVQGYYTVAKSAAGNYSKYRSKGSYYDWDDVLCEDEELDLFLDPVKDTERFNRLVQAEIDQDEDAVAVAEWYKKYGHGR